MICSRALLIFFLVPTCFSHVIDTDFTQGVANEKIQLTAKDTSQVLLPSLSIRSAPVEILEVMVGESKVLECEAGGNPPPTIHWLKDGKRIPQSVYEVVHPDDGGEEIFTPALGLSFTRSRLFIDCATARTAGAYTCVAENTYSRKSKTTQLFVIDISDSNKNAICLAKKSFASPARIHMWTHTRLELMGNDVQLFCRPEGHPELKMEWFGPNGLPLIDGQKYQTLKNGDLIIRNISWSDMGGYTCKVKNSEGSDETLTFLYPTMPGNGKSLN